MRIKTRLLVPAMEIYFINLESLTIPELPLPSIKNAGNAVTVMRAFWFYDQGPEEVNHGALIVGEMKLVLVMPTKFSDTNLQKFRGFVKKYAPLGILVKVYKGNVYSYAYSDAPGGGKKTIAPAANDIKQKHLQVGLVVKPQDGLVLQPPDENCNCGASFILVEKTSGGPWWIQCDNCGDNKKVYTTTLLKYFTLAEGDALPGWKTSEKSPCTSCVSVIGDSPAPTCSNACPDYNKYLKWKKENQ